MDGNNITGSVNLIVKNLSPNVLCKEKYTQSRKICEVSNDTKCSHIRQLRVMKRKIVTTEAGAFGPVFGHCHL